MKKQQVFPPSQAPSQWSRWVTHLYGTSTALHTCAAHTLHTCAAHTRTHTHTHTHAVHKQGGCVYHTHTKKACCVQDIYIFAGLAPGPGGPSSRLHLSSAHADVMVHLQTARGTCMYVHLVYFFIYYLRQEVMFSSDLFIYLFICLSARLRKNLQADLDETLWP